MLWSNGLNHQDKVDICGDWEALLARTHPRSGRLIVPRGYKSLIFRILVLLATG